MLTLWSSEVNKAILEQVNLEAGSRLNASIFQEIKTM